MCVTYFVLRRDFLSQVTSDFIVSNGSCIITGGDSNFSDGAFLKKAAQLVMLLFSNTAIPITAGDAAPSETTDVGDIVREKHFIDHKAPL